VPEEIQPVKTRGQKLAESSLQGQVAAKEDTGAPIAAGEDNDENGIASLESLVAEALKEDEEDDKQESVV
jgi:hypothetical protein